MNTKLKQLTDDIVYLPHKHETDRPILAAISGKNRTLIVDAGNSTAHASLFRNELERNNIQMGDLLVITHWHWDHIFGMHGMGLPTIAHRITRDKIVEMKDYQWTDEALDKRVEEEIEIPFCAETIKKEFKDNRKDIIITPPDIIYEDKLEINLGGLTCIIDNVGGDHSLDSTIVYVKERKVIFLGDCLAPNYYAKKKNYNVDQFLSLLDKIESYDVDIYVESHCDPVERNEFLKEMNELRLIAGTVRDQDGVRDKIVPILEEEFDRKLNQYEKEMIIYLKNGLKQ